MKNIEDVNNLILAASFIVFDENAWILEEDNPEMDSRAELPLKAASGISKTLILIFLSSLLLGPGARFLKAETNPPVEESRLSIDKSLIDRDIVILSNTQCGDVLAKQFGVSGGTLQQMRGRNMGWGLMTIQLAAAQILMQKNSIRYSTMQTALEKVGELWKDGKGWGQIASELNFRLAQVVQATEGVRRSLHDKTGLKPSYSRLFARSAG
jgi:hypothetical protein